MSLRSWERRLQACEDPDVGHSKADGPVRREPAPRDGSDAVNGDADQSLVSVREGDREIGRDRLRFNSAHTDHGGSMQAEGHPPSRIWCA
jgi:hypothetical protein